MSHFIKNQWQQSYGEEFSSINPATGKEIWQGNTANIEEIDLAVSAARDSFSHWGSLGFGGRLTYLQGFITKIQDQRKELAQALAEDSGKVIWECDMEIGGMINKLNISVNAYKERCASKKSPLGKSEHIQSITRHKPHGVIAIYGPYNFPAHVPNGHIIPALLAGNTVVFKPSELTPYISDKIFRIWQEAGLPAGVINMVQGQTETAIALAEHQGIDGIFFTGSSRIGKTLHRNLAGNPSKILALEMGGNNPLVVHQAQNIDAAVYHTIVSAFSSAGQRCTCARRLILIEDECQAFLDKLTDTASNIKIGDPLDADNFMGPVISSVQASKLIEAQASLINKGAKPLLEMQALELGDAYVSPGILDCTGIEAGDEEYFGPLLQVYRVKDWQAAITKANDTNYGLSAGLISDDKDLHHDFYYKVRAGLINWNNQLTGASSSSPFGGIGDSGNHRPSAYYAADYCSYPVASLESSELRLPEKLSPGIDLLVEHGD